jgi:hypothetical protein
MFSFVFGQIKDIDVTGLQCQNRNPKFRIVSHDDGAFTCERAFSQSVNYNIWVPLTTELFYGTLVDFYDEFYGVKNALDWLKWHVNYRNPRYNFHAQSDLKLAVSRTIETAILGIYDGFYFNVQIALEKCRSRFTDNNIAIYIYEELMMEYDRRYQRSLVKKKK